MRKRILRTKKLSPIAVRPGKIGRPSVIDDLTLGDKVLGAADFDNSFDVGERPMPLVAPSSRRPEIITDGTAEIPPGMSRIPQTDYRIPALNEIREVYSWRDCIDPLVEFLEQYRIDMDIVHINHISLRVDFRDYRLQRSMQIYIRLWFFSRILTSFEAVRSRSPELHPFSGISAHMSETYPGTAIVNTGYM